MFDDGWQTNNVTPIEALTGVKTDVSDLRELDSDAYINIARLFRDYNVTNQARKGMMVSDYGEDYRISISKSGRIMILRDVRIVDKLIHNALFTEFIDPEKALEMPKVPADI